MSDFSGNDDSKGSRKSMKEKRRDNMIPETSSEDEEDGEDNLESNRKLLNKIEFD